MSAPAWRAPSRRRALALLLTTACALLGLGVLAAGWVGVGTTTARASDAGDEPCLVAVEAGAGTLRYELVPARAVCVADVDGVRREVVVAEVPQGVTVAGLALAAGGVVGTVAALAVRPARPR